MKRSSIEPDEYNSFYHTYLRLIDDEAQLLDSPEKGKELTLRFYGAIPQGKLHYAYAEGKWTVLEVLQHIIDTERIFGYRVLRLARNDRTELPGFEQDDYIKPAMANGRSVDELLDEYTAVRQSTLQLIKGINPESMGFIGRVSGGNLSARAAAFIIVGHEIHHANIVSERYL